MAGEAFGRPGIPPTWTSSAKDLVTTAIGPSRVWVTLGHGILNEVYWPSTGEPQIRDLGFIVSGRDFWTEVKRVHRYSLETPAPDVPLPRFTHEGERYRLVIEVCPDDIRDVVLVRYSLEGDGVGLHPLLAPHLGVSGWNNSAWVGGGALLAASGDRALCLVAEPAFRRGSAGYVGFSDGWQDFSRNGAMTWTFERAADGNVGLMGELPAGEGVLALGFSSSPEGARTLAESALAEGYEAARDAFLAGWRAWKSQSSLPGGEDEISREARRSAAVLKVHEDRHYPGAVVASLSVPWGSSGNDPGGYHMVWSRDAVEAGFGCLAAHDVEDVRRMVAYLASTQSEEGRWSQNFYPDGRPHWTGVQMDEVGFPVLLAAKLGEEGVDAGEPVHRMVRGAASYIARHGPVSPQDRWEENPGASPFTLAVEIAALVAAGDFLEASDREYALALADCWNERLEEWTYVRGTPLDCEHGVDGHYVRIGPAPTEGCVCGRVEVKNREGETVPAEALIGLDFLYLVRLGLRRPDDARVRGSVRVTDAVLRVDTPSGPAWYRYDRDGYGEHEDGSPFDGRGIGRPWPLLTGERGHYALQCGEDPLPYLEAIARMAGPGGMIPEQVWDRAPIPERGLFPGRPTGSAMPLVWAHAEFLKLFVARQRGVPIESLESVRRRYGGRPPRAATWFWREEVPFRLLPAGRDLVIEARDPFLLHVALDAWEGAEDRESVPLGLGMQGVLLRARETRGRSRVLFTRRFEAGWEGRDQEIALEGGREDR